MAASDFTVTETPGVSFAGIMRGLWQLAVFVLIIAVGMFAIGFGVVAQFDADASRALRATMVICGGGFFVISLLGGVIVTMIVATRHFSTATAAGMQKALDSTASAQQQAITALTHQMEVSNARQEAVINTLAGVFTSQMNRGGMALPARQEAAPVTQQIGEARQDLVIGGAVDFERESIEVAASAIWEAMYHQNIRPTQANIKRHTNILSNHLISQAMQRLRDLGWAQGGGQGAEYEWIGGLKRADGMQ
jgi:hypothetical protein